MSITSLAFVAFTCTVLVVYYLLPRRRQNYLLLAASIFFIASWNAQYVVVFAVLTVANFVIAQHVAKTSPHGRLYLRLGIIVNVAALGFFKYADFFIPDILDFVDSIGLSTSGDGLKVLLPVGLSFYAVQSISYLLDIRNGVTQPTGDLVDFALYMVYFPRLTSGPIEYAREFLPKLAAERAFDIERVERSLVLILVGCIRKIVVADLLLMILPGNLFENPSVYSSPELLIGLLAYAFALYNDFAGYTNIVRGVSGFFGIELSQNFNAPYLSRNFTEFWQRWHITLSNWLRDYSFTPLTRALLRRNYKRNHVVSIILPPMGTMLVSALWHNVSLNMFVWGGMQGTYQVVERVWTQRRPRRAMDPNLHWTQMGSVAVVFVLAVLAWVPFRMSMPVALDYWQGLLSPASWANTWATFNVNDKYTFVYVLDVGLLISLSMFVDIIQRRFGEFALIRTPAWVRALVVDIALIIIIAALIAQNQASTPFIYQGF